MRLFIQIPCFNEETTLPQVIADLPRDIEGIEEIFTVVIDDGSSDATVEIAKRIGVDFIVRNPRNLGLANSFTRGIEACLFLGADIVVNTDGDNQYCGADVARLVRPLLDGQSDLVVGCRDISNHLEFSWLKKLLQRVGSGVVRRALGTAVSDTTSGFRAFNRIAAMRLSVMSEFSYTLEMLIQAGRTGLGVASMPIRVNSKTRESRLFRSLTHFVSRQIMVILNAYLFYCPMRFFGWLAIVAFAVSAIAAGRIAYFLWFAVAESQKFKSGTSTLLIVSLIIGSLCLASGFLGGVLSGLRYLIMDLRFRLRDISLHDKVRPNHLDVLRSSELFRWKQFTGVVNRNVPIPSYEKDGDGPI